MAEFSNWIGGNDGNFLLSVVISMSMEGGERWLAVSIFLWSYIIGRNVVVSFGGVFWGDGVWADPFSKNDSLPSQCWLIHGSMRYQYQWQHNVAIAVNHAYC